MNIKENQNKHITIKEIAKIANVSIATVSRVLNNKKIVKKEKKEKILNIISKLNYIPNPAARNLAKKKTFSIAVIVPNINNFFIIEILKGISEILSKNNIDIVLLNYNENSNLEKKIYFNLFNRVVDGAIFIMQSIDSLDFYKLSNRIPISIIERSENTSKINKFGIDNYYAMNKIINYLYKLGHRKIAYISGPKNNHISKLRTEAFENSLKNKKILKFKNNLCYSECSFKGGIKGYNYLLKKCNDFTAVVCNSDLTAMGAASESLKHDKIPGKDCFFVGYGGFPDIKYLYPWIISINYPGYKMGFLAAKSLVNNIKSEKKEFKKDTLKVNLIF